MIYSATATLHMQLTQLGIPIVGINSKDGAFEVIYDPSATADQIAQGNQIASTWPTYDQQTRHFTDIYTDIRALTVAQKTNIVNDLNSGTPRKALLDEGPRAPVIAALMTVRQCSFVSTAADRNIIDQNISAMYTADNVYYLSKPSFDPTIDVSALEPVT